MITAYLNDKAGVSNHAHSGLTTDSFRKEGHYAVIDQYRKPGDFFFFQFGHNDQKLDELKAFGGYRTNLARYINECRDKGGYPVLVTPVARNSWKGNDGSYNDLLAEYAESCREVGRAPGGAGAGPAPAKHGLHSKAGTGGGKGLLFSRMIIPIPMIMGLTKWQALWRRRYSGVQPAS